MGYNSVLVKNQKGVKYMCCQLERWLHGILVVPPTSYIVDAVPNITGNHSIWAHKPLFFRGNKFPCIYTFRNIKTIRSAILLEFNGVNCHHCWTNNCQCRRNTEYVMRQPTYQFVGINLNYFPSTTRLELVTVIVLLGSILKTIQLLKLFLKWK